MKTISTEELKQILDAGKDVAVINALSEESFRQQHIPKSTNIPASAKNAARAAAAAQ